MGSQRRKFTPEFKDEAVKLVVNTGRSITVVAAEIGISDKTLGRWVSGYRARHDDPDGPLTESERAELARLRKENADLQLDRAFLKKASIFNA